MVVDVERGNVNVQLDLVEDDVRKRIVYTNNTCIHTKGLIKSYSEKIIQQSVDLGDGKHV